MSTADSNPRGAQRGTKYRTYKRATDELAIWLASTADNLGIKGRDDQISDCSYAISISQFSAFTDQIIEATPRIEIPLRIIELARKAFLFRQERADLMRGTDLDSDLRHQHVISVIGEVCNKLLAHYKASKHGAPRGTVEQNDAELAPSFQLLEVEPLNSGDDHSDGEGDASLTETPRIKLSKNQKDRLLKKKTKAKKSAKDYYLADDEQEDPYFVLMCLLSDLKSMRDYIKEIWQEYKDEKLDLITVSPLQSSEGQVADLSVRYRSLRMLPLT